MSARWNTGNNPRTLARIGTSASSAASSHTSSTTCAGRTLTAGQLTRWAETRLMEAGHEVWRQNNIAVRGRKFTGRKGVPDIIGHTSEGLAVYCEVKTEGDRLSDDQTAFLSKASRAGCVTLIAYQRSGVLHLKSWADFAMIQANDPA